MPLTEFDHFFQEAYPVDLKKHRQKKDAIKKSGDMTIIKKIVRACTDNNGHTHLPKISKGNFNRLGVPVHIKEMNPDEYQMAYDYIKPIFDESYDNDPNDCYCESSIFTTGDFSQYDKDVNLDSARGPIMNIHMRPATEDDTENMYNWEIESIHPDLRTRSDVQELIRKDVDQSIKETQMIMDGDKTIGMFTACMIDYGEWRYIGEIYLIPEYRGKGIGTTILKNEINNYDRIRLKVATTNDRAIKLYKSLGFKIIKEVDGQMYIMEYDKTKNASTSDFNESYDRDRSQPVQECISYAMGVDSSIMQLKKYGFIINEDDGDYEVRFDSSKSSIWEKYISDHMENTYWNEYINLDNHVIHFMIKENDSVKHVINNGFEENPELLKTCNRLCEGDFKSIKELMLSNDFYKKYISSWDTDIQGSTPTSKDNIKRSNEVYLKGGEITKIENFKFNKVYFGSPNKLPSTMKLDGPLFVSPYIGIASIFAVRPENLQKYGVPWGIRCNRAYDEWDISLKDTVLQKPLTELHVRIQAEHIKIKPTTELVSGYLYAIDVTPEIRDHIYQSAKMNKVFEFCIDKMDSVTFSNIKKINVRMTVTGEELPQGFKEGYVQEAKLPSKKRKALDDSEFALVYTDGKGKKIRKYPIYDEAHCKAAARMFPRGVPLKYQNEVARKILRRAHKFGIDTSGWKNLNKFKESDK